MQLDPNMVDGTQSMSTAELVHTVWCACIVGTVWKKTSAIRHT